MADGILTPAMRHDHDIDFARWLHPAMWHVALESWQWIHQVAGTTSYRSSVDIGFWLSSATMVSTDRFRTDQGHCRRKWRLTDTDLCPCGETQMMYHIIESCPLTKLNGGLSLLHSANEDAVSWLTNYGSWHAYEKKIIDTIASKCLVFEKIAYLHFGIKIQDGGSPPSSILRVQ